MNNGYDAAANGAATAGFLAFMGIFWLIWLAVVIIVIAGLWKVFTKAGRPGWAAIVPIYNVYILLDIVGRPTWWLAFLLLAFIPFFGSIALIVVMFIIYWDLAKSFGKDIGYAIGLTLLGVVFVPMLGFGDAQYLGPRASGFGLPDAPGGAGYGGGYTPPGGGYTPPGGGYTPPGGGYAPPAPPTYAPPAPPAPPAYAPPAAPSAPGTPPAAPTYTPPAPPAAPPAAPTYQPPAAPEPPVPPAPPVPPV